MIPLALVAAALAAPTASDFPDPLRSRDGDAVRTAEEWTARRKPELRGLFQAEMYGRVPAVPAPVVGKVLFEDAAAFGGAGTLSEVAVTAVPGLPPVHLLIAAPAGKGPFPLFVGLNFEGNSSQTADERVRVPEWRRPTADPDRQGRYRRGGGKSWPLELIVKRGYAVATAYYGDIWPDDPKRVGGLMPHLCPTPLADRPADGTGAIMGWAWGISRLTDYLVTRPEIDARRLAVVGHSRLGKTALVAGAFDERFSVVIPSQSGVGGAGPSRHGDPKAESVKRITTTFPHWFCPAYTAAGDDPNRLPFDQNGLVALCAPRAVLLTNATDDLWANPRGQFEVLRAAEPVYKLLGADGLAGAEFPAENTLVGGKLGYWVRPGKHAMGPDDWAAYLAFADRRTAAPPQSPPATR